MDLKKNWWNLTIFCKLFDTNAEYFSGHLEDLFNPEIEIFEFKYDANFPDKKKSLRYSKRIFMNRCHGQSSRLDKYVTNIYHCRETNKDVYNQVKKWFKDEFSQYQNLALCAFTMIDKDNRYGLSDEDEVYFALFYYATLANPEIQRKIRSEEFKDEDKRAYALYINSCFSPFCIGNITPKKSEEIEIKSVDQKKEKVNRLLHDRAIEDCINDFFDSENSTTDRLDSLCFAVSLLLSKATKQLFPGINKEDQKKILKVYTYFIDNQYKFICENEESDNEEQHVYDIMVDNFNEWLTDNGYGNEEEFLNKFEGIQEKDLKLSFSLSKGVVSSFLGKEKLITINKVLLDDINGEPFELYVIGTMMLMRVIFDKLYSNYADDERFVLKYGRDLLLKELNK